MVISNEEAFERLFTDWFAGLHAYAYSLVKDDADAEEVVQAVFCRLWERRHEIEVQTSPKAYLYGCVYHECIDWLRRAKMAHTHKTRIVPHPGTGLAWEAAGRLELGELEDRFNRALAELPQQCRNVFQLSRFGELRYREIAEQLGISIKTVEAQMSKALKILREKLADHL
jgi:RNA polymerase sigma-70 factor (ECF subfamily)